MRKLIGLVLAIIFISTTSAWAMTGTWKITVPSGEVVTAMTYSPHGNRLVLGTSSGQMAIFDATGCDSRNWNGKPLFDAKGIAKTRITALAFDNAQKILAIGSGDGTVKFTNNTGALLKEFVFKGAVKQILFSEDNKRAMVLCDSNSVSVIDMDSYKVTVFAYKYFHPSAVAFGTSSNEIVEGLFNAQGEIIKGNIDSDKAVLKLYAHAFGVNSLVANAENNILISSGQDSLIKIWSLDSLQSLGQIYTVDNISNLKLTGDGKTLVAQCQDGAVKLFDTVGCIQTDAVFYGSELKATALKPDGRFIAAAYANGDVCIYSF